MADTVDAITKLIQSPPVKLAAGGVLVALFWKFFERIEDRGGVHETGDPSSHASPRINVAHGS
jgi:hypothetical protein